MPSLADPRFGPHCDRLSGTTATFCAEVELRRANLRGAGAGPLKGVMTAQGPSRATVVFSAPLNTTGAPATGTSTSAPGSCGPRTPPGLHSASRPAEAGPCRTRHCCSRLGRQTVTYTDRTLTCVDCGVEFIHSAADQEFYAQKGFASEPKRCTSCRASRRATRENGYDLRDIGGPRGYERGDDRPVREYFAVICSSCGNQAQVPFKPRMDRPVYCSDCFRTVKT